MKHGKKILALLMALMLLVGMAPTSLAYAGYCPDGQHRWGPKEYGDYPPSCVDPGCWWQICTVCGEGRDGEDAYGPHSWGPWITVREATCVESGLEQRTCGLCGATESRTFGGGGHQFGSWRLIAESTCVEAGLEQRTCGYCGATESRTFGGGGHQFGSWRLIAESTCVEAGLEQRTCGLCGATESRTFGGGGHQFGSWRLTAEPTCIGKGREEQTCSLCSYTQWRSIKMLDHTFGPWFVAIEPQVGIPGLERRICTFCAFEEEREIPALEPGFVFVPGGTPAPYQVIEPIPGGVVVDPDAVIVNPTPDTGVNENNPDWNNGQIVPGGEDDPAGAVQLPTVVLDKHVMNTPANGEFFVPGERIRFGLTLWVYGPDQTTASSEYIVKDIALYDPLKGQGDDGIVMLDPGTWNMGNAFFYTVTEEDAQRGYVENTGYATWVYVENGEAGRVDSNTVTAPCGQGNLPVDGEMGLTTALTISKELVSTPANGEYFVPGEDIEFKISYANTGSVTLKDVALYDPLLSTGCIDIRSELAPGSEMQVKYTTFYLSEREAATGGISNYAYVVGFDENREMHVETSNIINVPCGMPFVNGSMPENPFGVLTGLDVTKAEESLPLNGSYYTEGETVSYKITYVNSGEIALTDVMIYDAMGGMKEIATAENLAPGESRTCWFNHTVTKADVAAGYIANTAIGQFAISGYVTSVSSNTVVVDTDGKQDSADPSAPEFVWGTLPGDEYKPGTGWITVIITTPGATSTVPGFGTIDTDKLKGGESYCVRTITGKDNTSASYEISFCADHVDAQSSALLMNQAAAAPEMKLQAASYAVAMWRAEVEALYQEILDAADSAAKATVMTEYVRFMSDLANYEAMLNLLYPDQPAQVAQMIAAKWEDKCVTLCYEIHAAAAERKDSLLNATAAPGAEAVACSCGITAEENGKKAYTQNFCAAHSFPFGMIDALLNGRDTAEAWTMVRQIWGVELSSAYNKLSAKLGENSTLAAAEYNALTLWMAAREASLIALYPENPELVAQTMVKIIMDRVNALCEMVN